jgi:predicted  nucleic acid-binding Zn-ribbon protein
MSGSNKKKPDKFLMSDNMGIVHQDGKTYKAISYHGPVVKYEEIDVAKYDARVQRLVEVIRASPKVDLTDILRDALYDIPLERLDKVEVMILAEAEKAKLEARVPDIKTAKRERGTCINLDVAGRFCAILRQ